MRCRRCFSTQEVQYGVNGVPYCQKCMPSPTQKRPDLKGEGSVNTVANTPATLSQALGVQVRTNYPQRGPLHQYRMETAVQFHCFRCERDKTAKLVIVYENDPSRLLCNGCYGLLLSQGVGS